MFKHAAILILLLWASPVFATTYWVGKSGTGNCASADGPTDPGATNRILTIAAGIACMSGGDTLIIGDGTYAEYIADVIPSGSASAPTTIQAEHRNLAILRGFRINNGSYITLDGLYADTENSGIPYYCIAGSQCSNITIKNGTATRSGGGYSNSGIQGAWFDSLIQNMDLIANGDSEPGQSFLLMGNHSMYMHGNGSIIEDNRIQCKADAGSGIDHRSSNTGNGVIIRNNIISGCALAGIWAASVTNGQIYNNIVYNGSNTSSNGFLSAGIVVQGGYAYNVAVSNNTIFDTDRGIPVLFSTGQPDTVAITNNVLYQTGTGITNEGLNVTCTTNFNAGGNGVQSSCSATLGTTDPRFANTAGANFRLCTAAATPHASCAGASGLIDQGTTLLDVDFDIVGTARPQQASFDIGAYEAVAGASDPVRVSFATDNFTNASTALLSSYSAANWAIVYDNGTANGVYVDAATDRAYGNAAWATGPWVARRADTGTGWLNDQYTSCQTVALPPTTPDYVSLIAVAVRVSTDTNANRDYVFAEMYGYSGGRCVSLHEVVNGVKSNLGNDCGTTWTTSDFLEIDVIGSTVRVLKNQVAIITATTTLTTGFPGIGGAGNVGSIVAALDNCDFGGFDEPAPPSSNLTLSLPAAGTVAQRPDPSVRIEWTAQNITGNVELEYSLNDGADYFAIATVGYNTSPYFWTANVPKTSTAKVRVRQAAVSDTSGAFSVRGQYIR